jgi:hypothetical protein
MIGKRFEKLNLLLTKKLIIKTGKFLNYHLKEEELIADVLALITSSHVSALFHMLEITSKEASIEIQNKIKRIKEEFSDMLSSESYRK